MFTIKDTISQSPGPNPDDPEIKQIQVRPFLDPSGLYAQSTKHDQRGVNSTYMGDENTKPDEEYNQVKDNN